TPENEATLKEKLGQHQRSNKHLENNEDTTNAFRAGGLTPSARTQGSSPGRNSNTPASEDLTVQTPSVPPSQLENSTTILDIDSRHEGLSQSQEELDLGVIIPPSLPNNVRISQCLPALVLHHDK